MPQDLFTLKRAVSSLSEVIVGAKINKVLQPTSEEVVLLLYNKTTFKMVISTNAELARVSLSNVDKPNPDVAYNFCMLLRKHILGGRILSINVFNDDRTVEIKILNNNEFFEEETFELYAEIMGKYSNLFLCKKGVILGSIKQRSNSIDSKRVLLVGGKYTAYEKPLKISILNPLAKSVFDNFNGDDLKGYLLKNFYDFAPVTAGEIAYRIDCFGDYNSSLAYQTALDFINQKTQPVVIKNDNKLEFFAFDYKSVNGEKLEFSSLLSAMEFSYAKSEKSSVLNSYKNAVTQAVKQYEKRVQKRLATLSEKSFLCRDFLTYKLKGELITQYIYLIKKGQTKALLTAYTEDGESQVEIELDGTLTPQQNAQNYFKKYHKQKTTVELSSGQIKEAEDELFYINSVKFALSQAETKQDIEEIKAELISNKIIKEQKTNKVKKQNLSLNLKRFKIDNYDVYLGKNNLQNDKVLSLADKKDLWFHVKDYHSSHLVIKNDGDKLSSETLLILAEICAYYSQAGKGDKIDVDYTERRCVKKQGGTNYGGVYYTDYKTLRVIANAHDELLQK